jgi:hypothetical protein
MKKIKIESLTNKQLDYAFAKVVGLMLGNDSVVYKQDNGHLHCLHLNNFNPSLNLSLLKHIFKINDISIKMTNERNSFTAKIDKVKYNNVSESLAMIICYLLYKTDGFINIPKKIF